MRQKLLYKLVWLWNSTHCAEKLQQVEIIFHQHVKFIIASHFCVTRLQEAEVVSHLVCQIC